MTTSGAVLARGTASVALAVVLTGAVTTAAQASELTLRDRAQDGPARFDMRTVEVTYSIDRVRATIKLRGLAERGELEVRITWVDPYDASHEVVASRSRGGEVTTRHTFTEPASDAAPTTCPAVPRARFLPARDRIVVDAPTCAEDPQDLDRVADHDLRITTSRVGGPVRDAVKAPGPFYYR